MLKKIDEISEKIANWIVILSGITVCVLIFAGAFARYILHTDFYGSEELILLAAFWLYFIGSALAAKHDTQIKAEMLDMFIKNKKILKCAKIVKYIISLSMAALASVWAIQYVIWLAQVNMTTNVFRFPVYLSSLPIAISFVAWSIYCIRDMLQCIMDFRTDDFVEGGD